MQFWAPHHSLFWVGALTSLGRKTNTQKKPFCSFPGFIFVFCPDVFFFCPVCVFLSQMHFLILSRFRFFFVPLRFFSWDPVDGGLPRPRRSLELALHGASRGASVAHPLGHHAGVRGRARIRSHAVAGRFSFKFVLQKETIVTVACFSLDSEFPTGSTEKHTEF